MPEINALSQKRLPSPRAVFWQCVLATLLAFAMLAGISGMVYGLSKEALITEIRDGLARTARIGAASVKRFARCAIFPRPIRKLPSLTARF
jgi:hypothetical protein